MPKPSPTRLGPMRSCTQDAILRSSRIRYATVPRIAKCAMSVIQIQAGRLRIRIFDDDPFRSSNRVLQLHKLRRGLSAAPPAAAIDANGSPISWRTTSALYKPGAVQQVVIHIALAPSAIRRGDRRRERLNLARRNSPSSHPSPPRPPRAEPRRPHPISALGRMSCTTRKPVLKSGGHLGRNPVRQISADDPAALELRQFGSAVRDAHRPKSAFGPPSISITRRMPAALGTFSPLMTKVCLPLAGFLKTSSCPVVGTGPRISTACGSIGANRLAQQPRFFAGHHRRQHRVQAARPVLVDDLRSSPRLACFQRVVEAGFDLRAVLQSLGRRAAACHRERPYTE